VRPFRSAWPWIPILPAHVRSRMIGCAIQMEGTPVVRSPLQGEGEKWTASGFLDLESPTQLTGGAQVSGD
jgi:hypothetical protein